MTQPACVRTIDLANAVRDIAVGRIGGHAPVWAATFEDSAFFQKVRALTIAAGAGDVWLYVLMRSLDGSGQAYSFGSASSRTAPFSLADNAFPIAGNPPSGSVMVMVVDGVREAAAVSITLLKDGLPHGFVKGMPARVEVSAAGTRGAYSASGVPLTDLVIDGAPTAAATLAVIRPTDLSSHPELLAIVASAETAGAGIILRTDAVPGAAFIRPPGTEQYELVDRAMAETAKASWDKDAAILTVAFDTEGDRAVCVRRVAGLVQGEDPISPGVCISTWSASGTDLRFKFYNKGRPISATPRPTSSPTGSGLIPA